jgi:hypothetical protein
VDVSADALGPASPKLTTSIGVLQSYVVRDNVCSVRTRCTSHSAQENNCQISAVASFQLSAGRLADLWSAGWVFIFGIGSVAVVNLVLSFRESSHATHPRQMALTQLDCYSKQPGGLPCSTCSAGCGGCYDDT